MAPASVWDYVESALIPRLSVGTVYPELASASLGRRYRRGGCPFASSRTESTFVVDTATLRWSCLEHCRKGGQSVLAYLNGGRFPRVGTGELKATIDKAAALAGVDAADLPEISRDTEQYAAQQDRIASLLETFLILAQGRLNDPSTGQSAHPAGLAQLAEYGFDREDLAELPIGWVGELDEVRAGLEQAGFAVEEIHASALLDEPRLANRLVGPIRQVYGRIQSFWAWDPLGRRPRLLFKGPWKEVVPLVGLDSTVPRPDLPQQRFASLVVFERLWDALLLEAMGFVPTAAIAGPATDMTRKRWERLAALGIRQVTLVPDPTPVSRQATAIAIENALRAKPSVAIDVVLPDVWSGQPGAVAWAKTSGLARFQGVLEAQRVHALAYLAHHLVDRHQPATGWTEAARHTAWKEAIEWYTLADRQHRADWDAHFVPTIVARLGRRWEDFEPVDRPESNEVDEVDSTLLAAPDPGPAATPSVPAPTPSVPAVGTSVPAVAPPVPSVAPVAEVAVSACDAEALPSPEPAAPVHPPCSSARPTAAPDRANGYCPLHRCDSTVCFCFD